MDALENEGFRVKKVKIKEKQGRGIVIKWRLENGRGRKCPRQREREEDCCDSCCC